MIADTRGRLWCCSWNFIRFLFLALLSSPARNQVTLHPKWRFLITRRCHLTAVIHIHPLWCWRRAIFFQKFQKLLSKMNLLWSSSDALFYFFFNDLICMSRAHLHIDRRKCATKWLIEDDEHPSGPADWERAFLIHSINLELKGLGWRLHWSDGRSRDHRNNIFFKKIVKSWWPSIGNNRWVGEWNDDFPLQWRPWWMATDPIGRYKSRHRQSRNK